jgi:hypothetical protein
MPERQRMTTRLKALFARPEIFILAGGMNPIGAKMAEDVSSVPTRLWRNSKRLAPRRHGSQP